MFNGMMDPELLRLAQEQMSRMSPAEWQKIQQQMMTNPELMKMATESMKNMRPEDLKRAAEQLNHTCPEDMAEIGEKLASSSPEEIAAMRARVDAQMTYEYNAADMLKKQGNELHSQGKFNDAMEKYMLAKKNLKGVVSSKGRALSLTCSLNLMSCYLKTKQFDQCIKEGSEVLECDAKNLKALYRRGQAYKELGQLEDAVCDLTKALEVLPGDETIADVLRDAKERLDKEGRHHAPGRLVIEEITEEVGTVSSGENRNSSTKYSVTQPQERREPSKSNTDGVGLTTSSDSLQSLKNDPDSVRSFQNFISSANPETLAALSGGRPGEISPDMFKTASNMISNMSPEELQKMLQFASSFQGGNPATGSSSEPNLNSFNPGTVPQNVTPDMLKTASDMMSKMPPEELQKMFEMASSVKKRESASASAALNAEVQSLDPGSRVSEAREDSTVRGTNVVGETSSPSNFFSNERGNIPPNFTPSTADMQQLRNQMNDPAFKQMLSSMMKNMRPDMMASMSEQFGFKLSEAEAAKLQQITSSLSPDDLDKMMRWADKLQRGVEGAKKAKNWLLGRPGMILAIVLLILAVILHRLGYVGS